MLEFHFDNFMLYLMVVTRVSGAILFNPLFGRRNVPAIVKIGLSLLIAALITPVLRVPLPVYPTTISMMIAFLKEMAVGYVTGYLMWMFTSWVLMAGELVDMQLGLSMGRIFDPNSNTSMSLSGTAFNTMLTLIFFVSNGHLTLIRILANSCHIFTPGTEFLNAQAGSYLALMLGEMIVLALKLAMPVVATELLSEAGMGVLMKIVPQVNVFAVSLQVKIAVGLIVIIVALPAMSRLMDSTLVQMYDTIQNSLAAILSST